MCKHNSVVESGFTVLFKSVYVKNYYISMNKRSAYTLQEFYNTLKQIKATVVYRSSMIINRLSETGVQTKTEGNTSTIRGKQRKNKQAELQQKLTYIGKNYLIKTAKFLIWYWTFFNKKHNLIAPLIVLIVNEILI